LKILELDIVIFNLWVVKMYFSVKSIRPYALIIGLGFIGMTASAEWTKIGNASAQEPELYMDLDSVKQTGPMAIHRQVNILSQGSELRAKGIASQISLYEYDCMNSKLRVLETSAYSKAWAAGETTLMPLPPQSAKEWLNLPAHALGQIALEMVCPGTKGD
jgi:hypothetical protein